MNINRRIPLPSRQNQRGFNLISLMIAIAIGVFLLLGISTAYVSTLSTQNSQRAMTTFMENERIAISEITNAISTAGYYPLYQNWSAIPPNPLYTTDIVFPAGSSFAVNGQSITGLSGSSGNSDTLETRFMADNNTLDCQGHTDAASTLVTNVFTVSNGNLQCSVNGGAAETIIGGVSSMSVTYGIDTVGDGTAHQYMNANTVSSSNDWGNVISVIVTLTFQNPNSAQAGQPATLPPIQLAFDVLQNDSSI